MWPGTLLGQSSWAGKRTGGVTRDSAYHDFGMVLGGLFHLGFSIPQL